MTQAAPADEAPSEKALQQRVALFDRLGWAHWARAERSRLRKAFPKDYPLF